MKNVQIILNAILSKNIFEYALIDKNFIIIDISEGISSYLDTEIKRGDDALRHFPEFVGSEDEIREIFDNPVFTYVLESIYKNEFYVNITVEHFDENKALVLLHNISDITLSKQKLLQCSNESTLHNNTLQKILNSQNALLFVVNNEEISYTNQKFLEYFGVKRVGDVRRKNLNLYQSVDSSLESYDALFDRLNGKEEYITINNDTFILQASLVEERHKLFTLTKITKLSKEMELDGLTGVYRKSYFNAYFEKLMNENKEAILVVVDIDNFKNINDSFGHQVGDEVLREFATLIQNNIRSRDILARWGGEEFLILFEDSSLKDALRKINSIRELIEAHNFKIIGSLTASCGMTSRNKEDNCHSFLERADKALYQAKNNGKNRVEFKKN